MSSEVKDIFKGFHDNDFIFGVLSEIYVGKKEFVRLVFAEPSMLLIEFQLNSENIQVCVIVSECCEK